MLEIAPGSILQRKYITERIKKIQKSLNKKELSFCDIGSGNGANSNLLLNMGLKGKGFDLNNSACENNLAANSESVKNGRYEVLNQDFLSYELTEKFDIIFSCMVIEHFSPSNVIKYFEKAKDVLKQHGTIITLVPASMKHWGIEDEIAGHYKRYSFNCFENISKQNSLVITHMAGLTFPVSNWLLPISNYIVNQKESHKLIMSMEEQTALSGNRKVKFKTLYPWYFQLLLNNFTMYSFHLLQKVFKNNSNSLIIYSELSKI